jgi:hypothetical protein
LIIYLEVESQDIALELPAKAIYIGYILDDMEQFVGQFEAKTVIHGDVMSLMQGKEFFLNMSDLAVLSIEYISFVMK